MDDEIILCVMPLFHVFAVSVCLHLALYCRGSLILLTRYRPDLVIEAIEREKATFLPFVPTIFNGLLAYQDLDKADFSSVRRGLSGSAPLPEETLRQWQDLYNLLIFEGYGQSEAGPVIFLNSADRDIVPGSVGPPLPLTEIKIADVATGDKILATGEQGEICLRGPQIMLGYRNRPEETAAALRQGWLFTGDIGELNEAGNLYICDRKKICPWSAAVTSIRVKSTKFFIPIPMLSRRNYCCPGCTQAWQRREFETITGLLPQKSGQIQSAVDT